MALQAYSLARDGSTALSPHFHVREFRCKDGSDPIFVDTALVELLERIREHFGRVVVVTSAYRTPAHNAKAGGAKFSQHLYGRAADIANSRSQAVTDTKLEELTREVREHNNFARRVPILEEQMKVANHRIADLEKERN